MIDDYNQFNDFIKNYKNSSILEGELEYDTGEITSSKIEGLCFLDPKIIEIDNKKIEDIRNERIKNTFEQNK